MSTTYDAHEALLQIQKVRAEYRRIETKKKLKDIQANRIIKYQDLKYSTGYLEKNGKSKNNQGYNHAKIAGHPVENDGDKYTKVNTTNMVPAIAMDNPEDSEDLDPTKGEIEEDTGSNGLSSPSVCNNTEPIFPWGDIQGKGR